MLQVVYTLSGPPYVPIPPKQLSYFTLHPRITKYSLANSKAPFCKRVRGTTYSSILVNISSVKVQLSAPGIRPFGQRIK